MMKANERRAAAKESGSVLVLALLVTLLILGVGLTAMYLSSSGMKVSGNITRRHEALSAADTGIERGLSVLNSTTGSWSTLLDGSGCSGSHEIPSAWPRPSTGARGAILCDGGLPVENVQVLSGASSGYLTELSNQSASQMQNVKYTVYIRNDDVEVDVANTKGEDIPTAWVTDSDERVVLRVEGTARDDLSFFAVEALIVVPPPMASDPCPYGQAGGCDGTNKNSGEGDIS